MNVRFNINGNKYDLSNIEIFITKLFKNRINDIVIEYDANLLKLKLYDRSGMVITKIPYAPNVKDKNKLGYYDNELNLCLLPMKDDSFIIKIGCNRNKPIRPLFITF